MEALVSPSRPSRLAAPADTRPQAHADPDRYRRWWEAAATDFPCIIVGMGRWGKVLAGVLFGARGSGRNLCLVARSNFDEVAAWADVHVAGSLVVRSLDDLPPSTLSACRRGGFAIVASEPARHLADWSRLRSFGLAVLVEKPLAVDPAEVAAFVREVERPPVTGVGIEFAMLPVWPLLRDRIAGPVDRIEILWDDPAGEIRHGAPKRRHQGVSLVADLSHHLASILAHFCALQTIRVVARDETQGRVALALAALDVPDIRVIISDVASTRRRRFLLREGRTVWEVDFGVSAPVLLRDGSQAEMPPECVTYGSSLRLELGAFLLRTRDETEPVPMTDWLADCAGFHGVLVSGLPAGSAGGSA